MTIGQRIAQKRKELGLSQEALGEELGVSRQSIYKWESDSALPEVEKLIALSRRFGVSVGWLLGVESESRAADTVTSDSPSDSADPAAEESRELTEAQLNMVEEIVGRYLAAQPKPLSGRRRKLFKISIAVSALCLIALLFHFSSKLDQLNSQYNNLQNSISSVRYSVDSQINGISSRVEEILKAQNHLAAEYGTAITAADLSRNTITFSAHAVPKTYSEGMSAVFLADCGDGPTEFPAQLEPGRSFSGEITMELTDLITLSVVFINPDGTRQTQLLDSYEYLYSNSFPEVWLQDHSLFAIEAPDGTLTLDSLYISVRVGDDAKQLSPAGTAEVQQMEVGLFLNQRLVAWAEPCAKPENYGGFDGHDFYLLPPLTLDGLTAEDKIYIAARVTDQFGRQFMVCEVPYVIQFQTDYDTPYLTYPSDGRYDRNPSNWIFS